VKQESKKRNAIEELAHAAESLLAARVLIEAQLFRESIAKLYYAIFHALRALLFTKGLEPKSHGGVSHYFNTHFVGTETFPRKWGQFFNRLMKYRHEADYGIAIEITEQDCDEWFEQASEFVVTVRNFLNYD